MSKVFFALILFLNVSASFSQNRVVIGAERLFDEYFDSVQNKTLGIVTNHSAILPNGVHFVDSLISNNKIKIKALFGPEHGFKGSESDGKIILNDVYKNTSIPVYSLYGESNKPSNEMLKNINLMIFDIQDIGARFYTFISTLYNTIEACAENKIELIILDRPNPIGGLYIDGPVLDSKLKSFVGIIQIPVTHGMTVGELALLMNDKYFNKKAKLRVIPMLDWKRNMYFDDCGLPWIKPSPNIINVEAELLYPGICLIEGTNISEGRGTFSPFFQIGAPFINSNDLVKELKIESLNGMSLDTVSFIPESIPGMSEKPKYLGKKCFGIKFKIIDRKEFQSVKFGVALIKTLHKLYPDKFEMRKIFNRLYGKYSFIDELNSVSSISSIFESWNSELNEFISLRKKYLIY